MLKSSSRWRTDAACFAYNQLDTSHGQSGVDGLKATHDATRHLRGGGGTFDRIVDNLRNVKLPFNVSVRHNVYENNKAEVEPLRTFVSQLADESGNDIDY